MPARLQAAYDSVIAELDAEPTGEHLDSKEDLGIEDVTEGYYVTKLWNIVWETVRQSYDDEPATSYSGKRVPVTIPSEVVEHPKVAPILAPALKDGQLSMPCADKITSAIKPVLTAIIADTDNENRRMRLAAIYTKHLVENLHRGDSEHTECLELANMVSVGVEFGIRLVGRVRCKLCQSVQQARGLGQRSRDRGPCPEEEDRL